MRTDHVLALERGDYKPFPAPVYVRGSVRTYAKLLKLDVMKIMEDLAAEMDRQSRPEEAPGSTRRRKSVLDFIALQLVRFGWKRAAITGLILATLFLILMVRAKQSAEPEKDPLADLPPPIYKPAKDSGRGYLPLPSTNW